VLAVGRNVLEIAFQLLSEQTTYRELGIDYFDRYRAERLKRSSLAQLQRLGYQVTLVPPSYCRLRRIFRTGTGKFSTFFSRAMRQQESVASVRRAIDLI
jgi:hypothetical protein